ncbi:hypothetical protein B0H17DRAFT_1092476 [Mycena rosella]|uniref:Uncharacterized protein n=1 Tax=Mycena rosella TaxID=1033263 RepID=A0AAD7G3H9_MYCRO|nr:hypothetical protein B0H17DRAFT_1092476 [Mycena rosella]
MSFMKNIFTEIASYRLGYAPQRPYPWRWTTPIVICAFIFISGFLIAINVPLSAYELDQEFTYRPNDTLTPLPLNNLIPEILQHPAGSFTPHTLTVGDTLTANNSVFNFTIVGAYDKRDLSKPVASFSYYNNPLSSGCDVSNMKAEVIITPQTGTVFNDITLQLSVSVTCRIPTLFDMSWNGMCDRWPGSCFFPQGNHDTPRYIFHHLASDLYRYSPTQPPCSLLPARLMASQINFIVNDSKSYSDDVLGLETTDIFGSLSDFERNFLADLSLSVLTQLFQNMFQSLYHLVRMELGIILENQIYSSPAMFIDTITDVRDVDIPGGLGSAANTSRNSTSDEVLMAEWADAVRAFNNSDRVPVIDYLRPVPRLKPLGAAVTSVFVSTFAMLSVLWTVFSLVAGAFAKLHAGRDSPNHGNSKSRSHSVSGSENTTAIMEDWDMSRDSLVPPQTNAAAPWHTPLEGLRLGVDNNIGQMRLSIARLERSLKKRGLLEEEDDDDGMEPPHQPTGDSDSSIAGSDLLT